MKSLTRSLLPTLATVLVLGGVQAYGQSTILATGSPTGGSFTGLGNGAKSFTFTTFDTSLGTLTGVTIELNGVALSGNLFGANETGTVPAPGNVYNPEIIALDLQGTITVTGPSSASVALSANTALQTMNDANGTVGVVEPSKPGGTASDGGLGNFTQNVTVGSTAPVGANSNSTTISGAGVSAYTTGSGSTVTITVTGTTFGNNGSGSLATSDPGYVAGVNNNTGVGLFGSAVASGAVVVQYTYTPVPEPAQTAGLLLGFALFVLVGRNYFRRSSSSQPCLAA